MVFSDESLSSCVLGSFDAPSPSDVSSPGENCTPDTPGISSISGDLDADDQLDSLDDWLVEHPDFSSSGRGSACVGEMTSFLPTFPINSPTANTINLPQIIPSRSLLFNDSCPPSPLSSPATMTVQTSVDAIYAQAFPEWWNDPLLQGAYPSESLLLTYKLHSPNCTASNFSDLEDSDMFYSIDLFSDPSSLLLSPFPSGSVSSNDHCSRNDSPAVIYDNVEHTMGASSPSDRDDIPALHSPVHTAFNNSPHLVLPSVLPTPDTTGPMSDAPSESSSPRRHRRTSSRLKAIRASPYPESPCMADVRRHRDSLLPPDSVNSSNILRNVTDDEHGLATAATSIPPKNTADSFSPSRPSSAGRSPKRIPCTHPDCNKSFTREHDLSKHLRNAAVHNLKPDPECVCPGCGASLSRNDALQRHQRNAACGKRKTSRKAALLPLS